MLNAFRHHSGSHSSAAGSLPPSWRAQRLPASQRFSLQLRAPERLVQLVLNAFRHHSGSHMTDPSRKSTPTSAQRLPASQRFSHRVGREGRLRLHGVLNAFRHHSGSHAFGTPVKMVEQVKCSTPSGITAVLTPRSGSRSVSPDGAQRLPASQRFSLLRSPPSRSDRRVLNAFRHHSGSHRCPIKARGKTLCRVVFTHRTRTPIRPRIDEPPRDGDSRYPLPSWVVQVPDLVENRKLPVMHCQIATPRAVTPHMLEPTGL